VTKFAFRGYLAFLVVMVLFSLSPFAFFGGLIVLVVFFVPFMFLIKGLGGEVSGHTVDGLVATSFTGVSIVLALTAFWLFYRAADRADKGNDSGARGVTAIGLSLLTAPVVIYFFYNALPGV
jgi:hypothetical protein